MGNHSLAEFSDDVEAGRLYDCDQYRRIGEKFIWVISANSPRYTLESDRRFSRYRAHKYQTLKMGDVYETVQTDFPVLRVQTNSILEE